MAASQAPRRGARAPADVVARARRVRLVLLDVDGVLTADRVLVDAAGRELRAVSHRDLVAIRLLIDGGRGVRRHVHWTTGAAGGGGAIRDVAELVLQAQGKWASVVGERMR